MTSKNMDEIIKRLEKLEKAIFGMSAKKEKTKSTLAQRLNKGDFSLNERAFIKRFAANKSGPKKFAILLAFLAKGDTEKDIERKTIEEHWKKMSAKALLWKFNGNYANEAKNQGFVDSRKRGYYNLTSEWENAL